MVDVVENKAKFDDFRANYPVFSYDSYSWTLKGSLITLSFVFSYSTENTVTSTIDINLPDSVSEDLIRINEDYIFRIGLIESLSYWKAYCSPTFNIKCGKLTEYEINWWKNIWYRGTGEFRYLNGLLSVDQNDWVEIICSLNIKKENIRHAFSSLKGNLVGFTGGKDSSLTLGILNDSAEEDNEIFMINPKSYIEDVLWAIRSHDIIRTTVIRNINPKLLLINEEGALNGHTPFSIVVAFIGLFTSSLRNKEYFIVSNEASANEPTVKGTDINHQYSKSFEFEKSLSEYLNTIWPDGPKYFSFLRPLTEVGIVSLLPRYDWMMRFISSCNKSSMKKLWCGECPKCLFAFLMFSAVWDVKYATRIIGVNMFYNRGNMETLLELTGLKNTKPFDCVGTTGECLAALSEIYKRPDSLNEQLLAEFYNAHKDIIPVSGTYYKYMCEFNENLLPPEFLEIIKKAQKIICHE